MQFASIPNTNNFQTKLCQAVSNNTLAHALLIASNPGGSALPLALALASYLHCENRSEQDSCGQCSSCQKMQKGIHPDVAYTFPISSTDQIKGKDVICHNFLGEWRNFIQQSPFGESTHWAVHYGGDKKQLNIPREESRQIIKNLSLKSFEGKFKVLIIWLPEFLHQSAGNALLKIIEEPPSGTFILLASHNYQAILTTILSRLQQFHVPLVTHEELSNYLALNYPTYSKDKVATATSLGAPNIQKAILALDKSETNQTVPFCQQWLRLCYVKKMDQLVTLADQFHKCSKMVQKQHLTYLLFMIRNALITPYIKMQFASEEETTFIQNFSKNIDAYQIDCAANLINSHYYQLERNAHAKILFLNLSIAIAEMFRTT